MKILNSKEMLFEEECVEYFSEDEYIEDLDRRRKNGWTRVKTPNFDMRKMEVISKKTNCGFTIRYKRFGKVHIGQSRTTASFAVVFVCKFFIFEHGYWTSENGRKY